MQEKFRILIGSVVLALLTACGQKNSTQQLPAVEEIIRPKYARGFEIHRLVDGSSRLVLFDLSHERDTLQSIRWKAHPVEKLACLSSTHICFLNMLGELHSLKASSFQAGTRLSFLKGQSMPWADISSGNELDEEKLLAIRPELFFVYPFGGKNYTKYLQAGIGCVQISEYLEEDPLGRAEWIKVFGLLLNKQAVADSAFAEIETRYLTEKRTIEEKGEEGPLVFFGSQAEDVFFAPPGNSFIARLISDAGGRYVFADSISAGNLTLSFERMFMTANACDYFGQVISTDQNPELVLFADERLRQLRPAQLGHFFYANAAEVDYFGEALVEPDVLLRDMQSVLFESRFDSLVYFRNLSR